MEAYTSPSMGDTKHTRQYFVDNMQPGNIVAFTVDSEQGLAMLSGRVIQIDHDSKVVTIRTKNGSIFYPKKDRIVWVRTGTRWPLGIYNALKFGKKGI